MHGNWLTALVEMNKCGQLTLSDRAGAVSVSFPKDWYEFT